MSIILLPSVNQCLQLSVSGCISTAPWAIQSPPDPTSFAIWPMLSPAASSPSTFPKPALVPSSTHSPLASQTLQIATSLHMPSPFPRMHLCLPLDYLCSVHSSQHSSSLISPRKSLGSLCPSQMPLFQVPLAPRYLYGRNYHITL